jgi:hypothetical protein
VVGDGEPQLVSGGVFRPFALVRGIAAATWSLSGDRLELAPFSRLAKADCEALDVDARDVRRFFAA